MPTLSLVNDATLKKFIHTVKVDKKDKDFLISKLPQMDFDERKALFETLTRIHLLDFEEERVLKEIKKIWEK